MSHKSTSKPSSHYSARTSSTGGNNHRGTTSYSSSSRDCSASDPYRRFLVSGTSSGRSAESASRQMDQWQRGFTAAGSRR